MRTVSQCSAVHPLNSLVGGPAGNNTKLNAAGEQVPTLAFIGLQPGVGSAQQEKEVEEIVPAGVVRNKYIVEIAAPRYRTIWEIQNTTLSFETGAFCNTGPELVKTVFLELSLLVGSNPIALTVVSYTVGASEGERLFTERKTYVLESYSPTIVSKAEPVRLLLRAYSNVATKVSATAKYPQLEVQNAVLNLQYKQDAP